MVSASATGVPPVTAAAGTADSASDPVARTAPSAATRESLLGCMGVVTSITRLSNMVGERIRAVGAPDSAT